MHRSSATIAFAVMRLDATERATLHDPMVELKLQARARNFVPDAPPAGAAKGGSP